jgi:hypothetical protein
MASATSVEVFAPFPDFGVWASVDKDGTIIAKRMDHRGDMGRSEEVIPFIDLKPNFKKALVKKFGKA